MWRAKFGLAIGCAKALHEAVLGESVSMEHADRHRDVSGRTIGGLIGGAHNSALRGYDRLLM
jgi:hypothetical protein